MNRTFIAAALIAGLAGAAHAKGSHHHGGHAGHAAAQADTPTTKAFREINARMHRDMDIRYTNDVDVDFVQGMIPHHQGAVEMAKVALEHAKEPAIRKLAAEIIKAQRTEIALMQAFLSRKRGAPPAQASPAP